METLLRDISYAFRLWRKRPLLNLAAVLCLAIGIGMTSIVFSLVDGILLRALPFDEADSSYVLFLQFPQNGFPRSPFSGLEYLDFAEQAKSFEHVAGIIPWSTNLTAEGEPERLASGRVTGSFFDLLGTAPFMGRTFTTEEQEAGESLVVLSHGLWQRRFGGENVLDQVIPLEDVPFTIIGVMPPEFDLMVKGVDVWVPLIHNTRVPRTVRGVQVIGKLAPGVSLAQAQGEMESIGRGWQEQYPAIYADSGWGMETVPIYEHLVGKVSGVLWLLFGAVGLVLLIACVNVANLLLAQSTTREKEVALRSALGSGRWGIIRQLLTESVLLATIGGILGLILAVVGLRFVLSLDLGQVPRLAEIAIDWRVLLFTLGVSLFTGILFGIVPALKSAKIDLYPVLKEGGKTDAGKSGRNPLRSALVIVEIALAVVVLIFTGLTIRSFSALQDIDPGFRTDGLLTMRMTISFRNYPAPHQRSDFLAQVEENVKRVPGVRDVGIVSHLPLSPGDFQGTVAVEGAEVDPNATQKNVSWRFINADYFKTIDIPLKRGRTFTDRDDREAPSVVIVDEKLAQRLWPDDEALGQRIKIRNTPEEPWREVVGVVGSIRHRGLDASDEEQLYLPYRQYPFATNAILVDSDSEPMALANAVRDAVWAVDPKQPIFSIEPIETVVRDSTSQPRFYRMVFTLFGGAAFILAVIGVYGVMAYSVSQRNEEMGLRLALGAQAWDVIKLVAGHALVLSVAGAALGVVGAWIGTKVFSASLGDILFGIQATDVVTYVTVPLVLAAVALVASLLPARRATRVDPATVLRQE